MNERPHPRAAHPALQLGLAPSVVTGLAALAGLSVLAGCSASPPPPEPPAVDDARRSEATADEPGAAAVPAAAPAPAADAESEARRRVAELAIEGEYEAARSILTELLVDRHLERARALLSEDNPQDGLLWIDRALDLDEGSEEAWVMRGEGSFQLAEQLVAQGQGNVFVMGAFDDALRSFERASRLGGGPRALFGASRAAYQLDRPELALDYARRGMEARRADPGAPLPDVLPQRILADAAYLAYVRAKGGEAEQEFVAALYSEAQDALAGLLGATPADPYAWNRLAYLHEWHGDLAAAQRALLAGLDRVPEDAGTLDRLAAVSRGLGGPEAAIQAFEGFLARHPEVAGAWERLGLERFEQALAALTDGADSAAAFERAETELARARRLDPTREPRTLGYEVMCRNGVGWCRYNQGDLEGAEAAFRSMEELFPGGLAWRIEGRLLSGVQGLHFVGAGFSRRSEEYAGHPLAKPDDLARAARIYDTLREYEPENPIWSNNAGFFHRDAGTDAAYIGDTLCSAARGEIEDAELLGLLRERAGIGAEPGSDAERAALRAAADEHLARAREHMERSYVAYLDASRLAPDDVGIVNDTALIAIYHLYRDLERAEQMLLRCVELGAEQLAAEDLDEDERWSLQNAWGDAHQNLGILHFHHRGDLAAAAEWFEKSVAIGPEPRPLLTEVYLPLCAAGDLEGAPPYVTEFLEWGKPCGE